MTYRKKLIEVALPLKAINEAYKDEPTAEEREEFRALRNKSFEVLDEWK